jgi:hypothetical protein
MKALLQKKIDELSAEIRHYPTPIARCDLHLPALLEERALLLSKLRELEEAPACSPEALWANDGGFHAA